MLFSILFGLSTDYEVFLVTGSTRSGCAQATTAQPYAEASPPPDGRSPAGGRHHGARLRIVHPRGERVIKEFGLGLAAAILVDAVVIRSVAIPAIMLLIGRANWWFPPWLDRRLPRISMEPELEPDDEVEPKLVRCRRSRADDHPRRWLRTTLTTMRPGRPGSAWIDSLVSR